ncbi:MAG: S41 family peptidase [Myxococcota bacterium]
MSKKGGQAERKGYYRQPTVFEDRVVFVSEDDLWEVSVDGGVTRRLTSGRGAAGHPVFSPSGGHIAFTATEEGTPEVFVMDSRGGPARQLTFNGTVSTVVGWSPDGQEVYFRSNYREFTPRKMMIYGVDAEGGEPREVPVGTAHMLAHQPDGPGRVLCRHSDDLARWKRYRGGTAAVLWIDRDGSDDWERLLPEQTAGLTRPMWIGERIYFVSDFEGYGNIYSCTPEGEDVTRHTEHEGFYVRFARTDGASIVYTCGGDLWVFDPEGDERRCIEVDYASPRTQLSRKFVDAESYLDDFAVHPKGHSLAVTCRGKLFNFGLWEGGVRQTGEPQGVRYRQPAYLGDGERIVVSSDASGEERLEVHRADGSSAPEAVELDGFDVGRTLQSKVTPGADALVMTNHRHEIVHVDLKAQRARVIDQSDYYRIDGFDISADGRWVAYSKSVTHATSQICIHDLEAEETHVITGSRYRDVQPVFDPSGDYLYFLSYRRFNPVYDEVFFELSFPRAMVPCVVALREDVGSPFVQKPRPLDGVGGDEGDEDAGKAGDEDTATQDDDGVEIDFDKIGYRIEVFPVGESSIQQLGASDERVFWTSVPVTGSLGSSLEDWAESEGTLHYFDFEEGKPKSFARGVSEFVIGPDNKTMAMWTSEGLQVVNANGASPDESDAEDARPSRKSGFIDLERVSVAVEPFEEWEQMLREAWRLMRDHFWREDMSGIDWDEVWERYRPLLDRVTTRGEFSDLVWTMQGELGTSHAYEIGGDYDRPPNYRPGTLGADLSWESGAKFERGGTTLEGGYRIDHIVAGEAWDPGERSSLARAGVRASEGDVILSINGRRCREDVSIQEQLVNMAGEEVEIEVGLAASGDVETYAIKTLSSEFDARYREWVVGNRERVHEATDGRVGYVHIPDMGPRGYSEFHRSYLAENTRKGLLVDVRYNGGGHVSQLILEKLARQRIGYDIQRWGKPMPYPSESVMGPMVALTNEHAGSDGDIFSHCFKLMELGPLLGKRTWGGVIGIWPRHFLVDGSVTTQPEFSFWFEDVGFGVENHGTDPDEEVELPPSADAAGEDPQLEAAIERIAALLDEEKPEVPEFEPFPNLRPPDSLS